jgi:hypothetical protein
MSYINNGLRGEGGTEHAGHGGYLKTFKPSAIGQLFDKGPLPPPPVSIPLPGDPNAVTKRKVRNRKVLRKIPTEDLEKFLAEIARLKQSRTFSDTSMSTAPASSLGGIRPGLSDLSFGSHMALDSPVTDTTGGLRPMDSASNTGGFNAGPQQPYNTDLGSGSTLSTPSRYNTPPDAVTPPDSATPRESTTSGYYSPAGSATPRESTTSGYYTSNATPRGSIDLPDDYVTLFRTRDVSTTEIANTVGHDATIDYPTQRNLVAGTPISSVLDEGLILTDGAMNTETLVAMPAPSTEPAGPGQTLASVISEDEAQRDRDRSDRRTLMLRAAEARAAPPVPGPPSSSSSSSYGSSRNSLLRQATVARIRAADEQEALSLTRPSGRFAAPSSDGSSDLGGIRAGVQDLALRSPPSPSAVVPPPRHRSIGNSRTFGPYNILSDDIAPAA